MRKIIFLLIFFLLALSFHPRALAQASESSPTQHKELKHELKDLRQAVKQDIKNSRPATPSGFNQKRCEAHVQAAKLRESSMAKRASNMKKRLDKIVSMVENYYTNKLVPAGKTVSNYDALIADVASKKASLEPLVSKVQSDSSSLTCTDDAAKEQFKTFRTDASALLAAFKAYRLSVVRLVQAVRSASGNSSMTPTLSPEVTP